MGARVNSQGVITEGGIVRNATKNQQVTRIENVEITLGGGETTNKWNKNSIMCFVLTSLLILAGIGVATWYTVEEVNSNNSPTSPSLPPPSQPSSS